MIIMSSCNIPVDVAGLGLQRAQYWFVCQCLIQMIPEVTYQFEPGLAASSLKNANKAVVSFHKTKTLCYHERL